MSEFRSLLDSLKADDRYKHLIGFFQDQKELLVRDMITQASGLSHEELILAKGQCELWDRLIGVYDYVIDLEKKEELKKLKPKKDANYNIFIQNGKKRIFSKD